ncbi:pterin-4-alpha-carbinolamine dehydratase [Pandoraea iniqua]|uniref:4a-hydroxytetrahydrobiopterin dehydratase n=1 Tax=Pandoraea iniqua TaxID=2508288 RepID=A0A5E4YH14_9BURK|nr:4a-hydroxytetrahydrobiopterin dehydratase [Pandoraea iniqua]VVE47333.1 pterin-4-alpha-carbinolamine dehydratase [Pandoraea iniqua]
MNAPHTSCDQHARVPVLDITAIATHLNRVPQWKIEDERLTRSFHFSTAAEAAVFVNRVAAMAESCNHHPRVDWWKRDVTLELYTHKSNGLTVRDFEFAETCDPLSEAIA